MADSDSPAAALSSTHGEGTEGRSFAAPSDLRLLLNQPPRKLGGSSYSSSCHLCLLGVSWEVLAARKASLLCICLPYQPCC
jgi:hypothetical protein